MNGIKNPYYLGTRKGCDKFTFWMPKIGKVADASRNVSGKVIHAVIHNEGLIINTRTFTQTFVFKR